MPDTAPRSYWQMCREEPFRIFFPLGVLVGISGVSLWPLYFSGLHKFYPGIMHARMMMEGFMGAFILGFLGTAAPRLTETPSLSLRELFTLLGLYSAAVGLHIAERYALGDGFFLALLLTFAACMAWRLSKGAELPPPSFVLVGFGFFNAIAGTVLLLSSTLGQGAPRAYLLGSLLLYQGFVLYLFLGVGGFLLPRFLQLDPRQPASPEADPKIRWRARAWFAGGVGALLLGSFLLEVFSPWLRGAAALRFGAVGLFLFSQLPAHRSAAPRLTLTRCLRLAIFCLLLGMLLAVFWPLQRVAAEHLVFIGGFTLMTFTVALRVVLGHSGQSHLFSATLPFHLLTTLLLLTGAALRVAGDFQPLHRGSLLSAASYLWMAAAAYWGWRVLPRVRIADAD